MVPIRCATTLPSACKETRLSCTWLFQGTNRGRNHTTYFQGSTPQFRTVPWLHQQGRLPEEQLTLWYLNSSSLYSPSVLDGARRPPGDGLSAGSCVKTAYCMSTVTQHLSSQLQTTVRREGTSLAEYGGIHTRVQQANGMEVLYVDVLDNSGSKTQDCDGLCQDQARGHRI